jgi:hypothetical protein
MIRAIFAVAALILAWTASASAQDFEIFPDLDGSKPNLDLRGQDTAIERYRPAPDDQASDQSASIKIKTCPTCMTPGEVFNALSIGARVYGGQDIMLQMPSALAGENTAIIGLRAARHAIGLYNSTTGSLEFKVSSQGAATPRVVNLGPSEILTVDCSDCHHELELSIETNGQPTYSSRYEGGTIVIPYWTGARWELAVLGKE